jgi:flavin-dependent dehydrogenase
VSQTGDYDVIVSGGGLAGLCLSIQLKKSIPGLRVLVLERGQSPRPEAAHKVGESSVEVASHYFRNVLDLGDLIAKEIPKFGLRFFMSDGENRDITRRLEIGPKNYLTMPSDQIDRGQFENGLAETAEALGVEIRSQAKVTAIELAKMDALHRLHTVRFTHNDESIQAMTPWVVDASGRAALLKKTLGLGRPSRHKVNAAWFRIDDPIDIDDWSDDPAWRSRPDESRRLSTNHLMGEGYWVWFIPLANGRTSVGIVADDGLHPFAGINTFEKSLAWLEEHEPQAAAIVRKHEDLGERMDFLALKNYSRDSKQVFSSDGWALTGDAGIFIDPLYSPGSDFIGISNSFICDLIEREHRGEAIAQIAPAYDKAYRSLAQTYLVNYYRQYSLMGDSRVMTTKIVWDFAMYWGGVANLFCGDRLCDPKFMERVNPLLQSFAYTNLSMQAYFREWAKLGKERPRPQRVFIDYAALNFLSELNANLGEAFEDDALIEQMERNLRLAKSLRLEIHAEAGRTSESLAREGEVPLTGHLDKLYEMIRAPEMSEVS